MALVMTVVALATAACGTDAIVVAATGAVCAMASDGPAASDNIPSTAARPRRPQNFII
jgi:hypothetical protein